MMTMLSLDFFPKRPLMRIIQCFPNAVIRSKVMTAVEAMGIAAEEEGLCIHFAPPKDMTELNKILNALQKKNVVPVEVELPDPLSLCC
jgi:hypothetical protein